MSERKKVLSFFAGVGGIDIAFENTGAFDVIYANEFDKNARITYEKNFNLQVDPRDIRNVKADELPDADVVLAGFPCQAFSVAGYRKGFEDERGDLFFETLRIIIAKQPEVVFLENVKNMVTHDNGNTFRVIRQGLEQNGYYLKWAVLNATEYGNIPQNRERIYIVGFKSKEAYESFEFPNKIPLTTKLNEVIDFVNAVDYKYYYSQDKNPTFYDKLEEAITSQDTVYQWRRQYVRENKSGVVPTLTANMGTGGHNVPLILSELGIRKLTPRETFKVQGFPKHYKLPEIADGQLYKQAGNSVVVPVAERIAKEIKKAILGATPQERTLKKHTVIYTNMCGSNSGKSYVQASFDHLKEAYQYAENTGLEIISKDLYEKYIRRKTVVEFLEII